MSVMTLSCYISSEVYWEEIKMELVEVRELFNGGKEVLTSSRSVAERFNKRHADIIRTIENYKNMSLADAKLRSLNSMFIESDYIDAQGKPRPEYLMNRDGFSFLVMSFTGVEAMEWKLKYIEAFNKLEEALIKERYKTQYLSSIKNVKEIVGILNRARKQGEREFNRTITIFKDYIPDDILILYQEG